MKLALTVLILLRFRREISGEIKNMVIPVQNLENGVYTILVERESGIASAKLEVAK